MRKNSIKNIRINAEVQRELSEIIRSEVKDPRIDTMTTVTEVSVTPDLKYATVYISTLAGKSEETIKGLFQAGGFIRKELASRLNLRNTPELRFVPDNSLEYGMKMSKLIDEVMAKEREDAPDKAGERNWDEPEGDE